jgi:NAD(P)-dependent dehydrogenase (short-subunit alcohol dehydrogenase family)
MAKQARRATEERMGRLSGKVALVTGAAQGIGQAVAELFAAEGAVVIGGDVRPVTLEGVEGVTLDVSSEKDWQKVVSDILTEHGHLDILVNNAGIVACYELVHGTDRESWDRVLAVNLTGSFIGMQAVLPAMRKAARARSSTSRRSGEMSACPALRLTTLRKAAFAT